MFSVNFEQFYHQSKQELHFFMNLDLLARHFYDLVDVLTQQVVSIFDELQRFFAAFSSVDFSKRNRCKQKNASQTDFY